MGKYDINKDGLFDNEKHFHPDLSTAQANVATFRRKTQITNFCWDPHKFAENFNTLAEQGKPLMALISDGIDITAVIIGNIFIDKSITLEECMAQSKSTRDQQIKFYI